MKIKKRIVSKNNVSVCTKNIKPTKHANMDSTGRSHNNTI